jgi:DNA-binding beta-propeller fold protein YncE
MDRRATPSRVRAAAAAAMGLAGAGLAPACGTDEERPVCLAPALPLQDAAAHTLGEPFYLPRPTAAPGCPADAGYEVIAAPAGSMSRPYMIGAPEPRFTPDVEGVYALAVPGLPGSDVALRVVRRSPAERFRNHYLTPLYGAAVVGDEIWTANGASYTVSRVALDGAARGTVTVGAWPGAIAWRAPLPYALVAARGSDTVGFVDRGRGVLEDALWVGDEPTAIAIAPDATRAWVSLPTMRQIAEIDLSRREVVARIRVGFDPRALALSADGRWLYAAAYRSGNRIKDQRGTYGPDDDQDLWIIDTAAGVVARTVSGISASLRAIAVSPSGEELYVAASDGDPIPSQADPQARPFVHEVIVVSIDPAAPDVGQVRRRADLSRQASSGGPVVSPAGVLAVGDQVIVAAESSGLVVALDAQTLAERWRLSVGEGARQLVATPDGAAVHCYQSRELWRFGLDGTGARRAEVIEDARPPEIALGESVFLRPGTRFAAQHACSSCHVEAQTDGMVWRFGPMVWSNVRPLQLLDATTPQGWDAYISSAQSFGYAGPSSIVSRPPTPAEARGLEAFLGSLLGAPRANGDTRLDGSYTEAALRGRALFEGKARCASCHAAPLYTSRQLIAMGKSGVPADVPTLLGVYRHGVYMVDGRARTLDAAVGVALDYVKVELSPDERGDLTQFLRELTPKGGAPLGIWPDLDSAEAVYPDVIPRVAFSEPIARPAEAAQYVRLEDASGQVVPAVVQVDGGVARVVPTAPLAAGQRYRLRALLGLPFVGGGALEAERRSSFVIARPAAGTWPAAMQLTVTVPTMGGPVALPLSLRAEPAVPGGLQVRVEPQVFGRQQRQSVWLRVDGERLLMQAFALPVTPTAVADASAVVGTVTVSGGAITGATGTLRISGPGIDLRDVAFTIAPLAVPPGPAADGDPATSGAPPGPGRDRTTKRVRRRE